MRISNGIEVIQRIYFLWVIIHVLIRDTCALHNKCEYVKKKSKFCAIYRDPLQKKTVDYAPLQRTVI